MSNHPTSGKRGLFATVPIRRLDQSSKQMTDDNWEAYGDLSSKKQKNKCDIWQGND